MPKHHWQVDDHETTKLYFRGVQSTLNLWMSLISWKIGCKLRDSQIEVLEDIGQAGRIAYSGTNSIVLPGYCLCMITVNNWALWHELHSTNPTQLVYWMPTVVLVNSFKVPSTTGCAIPFGSRHMVPVEPIKTPLKCMYFLANPNQPGANVFGPAANTLLTLMWSGVLWHLSFKCKPSLEGHCCLCTSGHVILELGLILW